MKTIRITAVLAVAALAFAACGGGGGATPDENGEIVIELDEFSFSPSNITVQAGDTVTFVLKNVGQNRHEFMIGREVDEDEGYPSGFHDNFFSSLDLMVEPMNAAMGIEGGMDMDDGSMDMTDDSMADGDGDHAEEGEEGHGFMVMRDSGEDATITVTIPASAVGEWEIACFEEDGAHYEDGMKGTLTVEG